MRKLIGIMLIAALLLTGCQMAREADEKKRPRIRWWAC